MEFYNVVAVLGVLPRLGCSGRKKILFMALQLAALLYYNLRKEVAVPTSGQKKLAETRIMTSEGGKEIKIKRQNGNKPLSQP